MAMSCRATHVTRLAKRFDDNGAHRAREGRSRPPHRLLAKGHWSGASLVTILHDEVSWGTSTPQASKSPITQDLTPRHPPLTTQLGPARLGVQTPPRKPHTIHVLQPILGSVSTEGDAVMVP